VVGLVLFLINGYGPEKHQYIVRPGQDAPEFEGAGAVPQPY
jgi:hypothetical protein